MANKTKTKKTRTAAILAVMLLIVLLIWVLGWLCNLNCSHLYRRRWGWVNDSRV